MQVEMADIFDENDVYTGITVPKHTPLLPGQFKRHAVIILKTEKGYITLRCGKPWRNWA